MTGTGTTSRVRRLRQSSERLQQQQPWEDPSPPTPSEPVPLPSWLGESHARSGPPSTERLPQLPTQPFQLTILRGKELIGRRVFQENVVRVGRSPTCGLCLDDSTVSRAHAAIERAMGGAFVVRDLASTNGVKVNGRSVTTWSLNEGDELTLGAFQLKFSLDVRPGLEPSPSPDGELAMTVVKPPMPLPPPPLPLPLPPPPPTIHPEPVFAAPPARPVLPEGPFGRTITLPPARLGETRERSSNQRAYLLCLEGAHKAGIKVCQIMLERDVFLIGGGDDADLRLPARLVPRVAAVIVRGHGGWSLVQVAPWPWIAKINDQAIEDREWIKEGDKLLLPGGLLLSFHQGIPR